MSELREKLNIGQRKILTEDMQVSGGLSEIPTTLKKGVVLFVGADKKFYHMLNERPAKESQGLN